MYNVLNKLSEYIYLILLHTLLLLVLKIVENFQCILNGITKWRFLEMFFRIGVIKLFATFTIKHLFKSLFLIKLQASRAVTLLKRDSNTGVFLYKLFFYRTPPVAVSVNAYTISQQKSTVLFCFFWILESILTRSQQ